MQRYYCPEWRKEEIFFLPEEETFHCHTVMRNKAGDMIELLDGIGHLVLAKIISISKKNASLEFQEIINRRETPNSLHVGISPTKSNDRIEWFIEKACEIGVGRITPIEFQRTERSKINQDRWSKLIISSCKQSRELWFPTIDELTSLDKFIAYFPNDKICVASIESSVKMKAKDGKEIIIIGPEGDFTKEELTKMRNNNILEISLSKNILRVETAGIAAVSQWSFLNSET